MKPIRFLAAGLLALAALTTSLHAQHSHGYIGDANDDGYLDAVSSDTGAGTLLTSFATRTMAYNPSSTQALAGYDFLGTYTFSALHGSQSLVSNPQGALSGTKIYMTLYAVAGPAGGNFAFFEADETETPQLVFSLSTGTTGSTNSFVVTEEEYYDLNPSDPYGHIHGRSFAADTYGTYTLTWVLTNSELTGTQSSLDNPNTELRYFTQTFNAVPEPSTWAMVAAAAVIGLFCLRRRKSSC